MKEIENKLHIYAKEGYNVLLTGRHGVGKTAMIKSVFEELFGPLGVNWLYFSASTLDPWVDFIGIPKNYTRPDGIEVFKIIPPESLAENNQIKAIFFDEINRAEEKTLNAVMELIQFKSINGRKFENLSCVWAAENPSDDKENTYAVRPLDPAQKDRFQIQIEVPSVLNKKYFLSKYESTIFNVSNSWWKKNADKISPRKLDDMLTGFMKGYDLSDFSSVTTIKELSDSLKGLQVLDEVLTALETLSDEDISTSFGIDRLRSMERVIPLDKDQKILEKVFPLVDEETQAYIAKRHKYMGNRAVSSNLPSRQKAFVKRNLDQDKIEFSDANATSILLYMKDLNQVFQTFQKDTDYFPVVESFPYFFIDTFKTPSIRTFLNLVNITDLKEWFKKSMFILSSSISLMVDLEDIRKTPLYMVLLRLSGNGDFCKKTGLNKIFFNGWKKDLFEKRFRDFSEYEKRVFSK